MQTCRWIDVACAAVVGLSVMVGAGSARAQGWDADWDLTPPPVYFPSVYGQWEGPYDLGPIMEAGGDVAEIGHAVFLADGPYAGQVMFWNVPKDDLQIYSPRSFIWNPDARDPINAAVEPFPALLDGSEDPFCGGHVPSPMGTSCLSAV